MGLAALIWLAVGVFLIRQAIVEPWFSRMGFGLGVPLFLAGTGFGFAAVRPPAGNILSIIVEIATVAVVLPLAIVAFFIVGIFFFTGFAGHP